MRRILTTVALATVSLFALGGVASADEPPVPPAFAPPAVTPVTDVPSANAFAENYASDNAGRFLRVNRRAIRVIDANAACLQSPVVDTRFGCIFTLKVLVISRRHGWDSFSAASVRGHKHNDRDHGRHNRRFRVRQFGCLGALTIDGGPTATPTAQLRFVECARIPRGDREVVAPNDDA